MKTSLFLCIALNMYASIGGKSATHHRTPHTHTHISLQNMLTDFTKELFEKPENYQKIATLFKVVLDNIDNTYHDYSVIKKTLEKILLTRNSRSSPSLDCYAINLTLQKLWIDKKIHLTPHAKNILKKYKEYNATCYKKTVL